MVKKVQTAENSGSILRGVWGFVMWFAGIIVSLAVGFGMVGGTLYIPRIHLIITVTAGWVVVILTILGALLKLIDKFSR